MHNALCISGSNLGIFTYGRKILRQYPQASLVFDLKDDQPETKIQNIQTNEIDPKIILWALEFSLRNTKFGRIAVLYDRKNKWINAIKNINIANLPFQPSDRRALTQPEIHFFEYQVLQTMAEEGLSNSVEFRRLARKYLRSAKQANVDTIVLLDSIMGDEKTKKQWQSLAGPQRNIITLADCFLSYLQTDNTSFDWTSNQARTINIQMSDQWRSQKKFVLDRAEKILQTKLKQPEL